MIYCELTITDPIGERIKRLPKAVTEAAKQAVRGWHKNILPGHFRTGAARRYDYKRRSAKYQRRKRKKGLPALVFSGRAQKRLSSPAFFKVTGSAGKAKGKFIISNRFRYLWMTTPNHPRLAEEITRTTTREERAIGKFIKEEAVRQLQRGRGTKVIIR